MTPRPDPNRPLRWCDRCRRYTEHLAVHESFGCPRPAPERHIGPQEMRAIRSQNAKAS